jgi:hypothetical protein
MSKYQYGTKNKIIKDIIKLEKDVRFIPIHRETQDTLESWNDEYLSRYRWILLELKTRNGGN